MLCALTSPLFEAKTDLGEIDPVIVFTGTNTELSVSAFTGVEIKELARKIDKNIRTLFLAIENRIGLKYWLGYSEDHTGKLWDGIEDYGGSDLPRTYTKNELSNIVELAGFDLKRPRPRSGYLR